MEAMTDKDGTTPNNPFGGFSIAMIDTPTDAAAIPGTGGPTTVASGEALHGQRTTATRLLNSPQSLSRPRVPIMVGGGGEKKTLRLVAQYADACNVFGSPEAIARKYAILDEHCGAVGLDPAEIERSTLQNIRLSPADHARTESPAQVVDRLAELNDAGAQHVIFELKDLVEPGSLETVGRDILPALHALPA